MHTLSMYAKVRRMRYRGGLSISEITRRTRLSRNTVKIWLREPARDAMNYRVIVVQAAAPNPVPPHSRCSGVSRRSACPNRSDRSARCVCGRACARRAVS